MSVIRSDRSRDTGARPAALARMAAERALVRRHEAEYRRLSSRSGHARAIRALVRTHTREYSNLYASLHGVDQTPLEPPGAA